jgi:chromosome segregation ATPase
MSKFIPVEPEKWAEMVKAMAENARLKALTVEMDKTINASQAECRRLKAEVERLTSDLQMEKENEDRLVREWQKANNEVYGLQTQVAALIDDQTRLKAEVESIRQEYSDATNHYNRLHNNLEAQVERLTKAGDEVIREWSSGDEKAAKNFMKALVIWNAAKEGKQP